MKNIIMHYVTTKITKYLFVTTLLLICFSACKDDDYIPEVMFNYYIDLNSVEYNSLKIPGNAEYLNVAGYRGVIIHCNYKDEYVAFERACPYHPEEEGAVVEIDEDGNATCPECGSQFSLYDGSILEGPAEMPLKWYNTDLQGNLLYVYN
ncbi:MAG: Rieske (2Fe-2S) protein [Bacteroidota bacterium]